jgi:hypothetical protein
MPDTTNNFEGTSDTETIVLEPEVGEVTAYSAEPQIPAPEPPVRGLQGLVPEAGVMGTGEGTCSHRRVLCRCALADWRADTQLEARIWTVLFLCGTVSVLYAIFAFFVKR